MDGQEALERHAEAAATVRAFSERSRAERVVLLVDLGEEHAPAMLDCASGGTLELTDAGAMWRVPADVEAGADPRPLPDVRPPPPTALSLDPETGQLEAPLGVVANLAGAVLALARAFGGRSVATADFATRNPDVPLTIAAREGEPIVVAAGEHRFELPTLGDETDAAR
jgi:hypothetical protein